MVFCWVRAAAAVDDVGYTAVDGAGVVAVDDIAAVNADNALSWKQSLEFMFGWLSNNILSV